MRIVNQLLVVAALAAVGGGAWYYTQQKPAAGPTPQAGAPRTAPPMAVETVAVETGVVVDVVEAVGTARAREAVVITPKVPAMVKKISFTEGERVKANQVLVELDAREIEARLEETRVMRENSQRLYDRSTKLFETRNVPQSRVEELQAQLEAAGARIRADEARLADYVIRAPFDGRMGLRRISLGALVTPGVEISTLDDTSSIKMDFKVPENALRSLQPGAKVEARSSAYPGRVFTGTVTTIGTRVDATSRSIELRAEVPNKDDALRPGMFLTASLVVDTRPQALLVPEAAVLSNGDNHTVFVVAEGKAKQVPVRLGQSRDGKIEIRSGVNAGDAVITGGLVKVRDGQAVRSMTASRPQQPTS